MVLFVSFIHDSMHFLSTFDAICYWSAVRSTIQAYGFLFIKKPRDPLFGIQQFEFLNQISTIQIVHPAAIHNLFQTIEWKHLTDSERFYFGQTWLDINISDSLSEGDIQDILNSVENSRNNSIYFKRRIDQIKE